MRRGWLLAVIVLATLAMPGCARPFQDQWVIGHTYTSPHWEDPGIYAALPDSGSLGGFTIQVSSFAPIPSDTVGGSGMSARIRLPALDAAWGADSHELDFARWDDRVGGDDRTYRTLQFEPDYIQGWFGVDRTADDARALFMEVTPAFLDVTRAELEALADAFVSAERVITRGGPTEEDPEAVAEEVRLFGTRLDVVPDFVAAFEARGGLPSFWTETSINAAGWLPVPGQVTLVDGPWKFYVNTVMKRLSRGSQSDGDVVWVAPTDVVQAVHFDKDTMNDDEAGAKLERVMAKLGRDGPDTSGWRFAHETVYDSWGD